MSSPGINDLPPWFAELRRAQEEAVESSRLLDATIREREDYNGAHQRACLEIERLKQQCREWREIAVQQHAEIERLREALIEARVCIVNYGDPKHAEKRAIALAKIDEIAPNKFVAALTAADRTET